MTDDWQEVLAEGKLRAHRAWVVRGNHGDGRFAIRAASIVDARTYGLMLDRAIFDSCDLTGSLIEYSTFEHAQFTDCVATRGSFYNSRFMNASFVRVRFEKTNLRSCWFGDTTIESCAFDASDVDKGNFVRAVVTGTSFRETLLRDTQLDHARFENCVFRGASLNDTVYGTQFVDCDFRGANLDRLKLKDTRFIRCKLAGIVGKPIVEGPFELTDSDFSTEDGAIDGLRSAEQLRQHWEARES